MRVSLLFLAVVTVGCARDPIIDPAGGGGIDGLVSITVSPASQTLIIDGTTPATSAYTAVGTFKDGHTADLTDQVSWTLMDIGLGSFTGALFTSTTDHGGYTNVLASAGDVVGKATLILQLKQRYKDPGSTGLPADPGGALGGASNPALAAQLVYPNDGVLVPPNLGKLEIHFKQAAGTTLFALDFKNAVTDVEVYLGCTNPTNGGCIYLPDQTVWHWIAESNRGGGPVMISVRATDGAGSTGVGTSNAISLAFSQDDIHGGLYYWTTSDKTAIMRFDFASTTQTVATKFIDPTLTGGTCVGCHALSRDGRKVVAEAGGQNDGRILLLDVASVMPIVPFGSTPKSIFETWDPGGQRYAGVYADSGSTDFNVMLFDGANGAFLGDIAGTGTAAHPADHPDWSLDGRTLAYVKVGTSSTSQRMWSGAIEAITSPDEMVWSAPTELVPSVTGVNHYYPAVSPENTFLVYDESTCPAGKNTDVDCNADTDPTATLWAVRLGGGAPIRLDRCNAPGLTDNGKTALTNSFPRWSPFVFTRGAKTETLGARLLWLTFSSTRNFGLRPPPPTTGSESASGTLVWMVGIDPDQIANGQDGCYAAFALPFQDLTTSNHIAQWTTEVIPPIQ